MLTRLLGLPLVSDITTRAAVTALPLRLRIGVQQLLILLLDRYAASLHARAPLTALLLQQTFPVSVSTGKQLFASSAQYTLC